MIHACSARRSQRAASIHKNLHFTTPDPRISAIKNDLILILGEYESKKIRLGFKLLAVSLQRDSATKS